MKVDRESCTGGSNCTAIAPTVFQLDEENKVLVLDPNFADEQIILEAAKSYPENAIIVEDDDGIQLYP